MCWRGEYQVERCHVRREDKPGKAVEGVQELTGGNTDKGRLLRVCVSVGWRELRPRKAVEGV